MLYFAVVKRRLTEKQREVLALMAEGKTTQQIADILGNSIKTIERIRHDLFGVAQAINVAHLIKIAYENGWLKVDTVAKRYYTIYEYTKHIGVQIDVAVFRGLNESMKGYCEAVYEEIGKIGKMDLYSEAMLEAVFISEGIG